MNPLEGRIRRGLRADVPVSADDLISAAAVAAGRTRRQRRLLAGVGAAAVVLAVIVGTLAVTRGDTNTVRPVGPTPSKSYESPGPDDHPISMYAADGVLTLLTVERLDRPGPATLWRKAPGGWLRVGTLDRTIGPDAVAEQIRLQPGPGHDDLVAFGLSGNRVGFSRDGGATWRYLAPPEGCAGENWCSIDSTGDWLYVDDQGAAWRAPFGATAWERFAVPRDNPVLEELDEALVSIESDCDNATNHYWVSRDHGDTWTRRRDFPAGTCAYDWLDGTAYAYPIVDAHGDQSWRSTDLVSWERAPVSAAVERESRSWAVCPDLADSHPPGQSAPVQIGDERYQFVQVNHPNGWKRVLRVSHDNCHTWKPVLP
jgi:hypothetical protein